MFITVPLLALLFLWQPPLITNYDPPAANVWIQTSQFSCDGTRVIIQGYGSARPEQRQASIAVNGHQLAGGLADRLKADLSDKRAVYRITARCANRDNGVGISVYKGVKNTSGKTEYTAGNALILNGKLREYAGLGSIDAESFWFR
jgi:hypothetical protein